MNWIRGPLLPAPLESLVRAWCGRGSGAFGRWLALVDFGCVMKWDNACSLVRARYELAA